MRWDGRRYFTPTVVEALRGEQLLAALQCRQLTGLFGALAAQHGR